MFLGIGATAGLSQFISNIRFAGKLKRTRRKASRQSIRERIALMAQRQKILARTLIIVTLIAVVVSGCTFTGADQDGPSPSVTTDSDGTPVITPTPIFSYPPTPSDELTAFADVLKPLTMAEPQNILDTDWRSNSLANYRAGDDLTYDEFTALIAGLTDLNKVYHDVYNDTYAGLTRAQYDARPSSWIDDAVLNLAQKPAWADVNGDGVREIVLATRTGGGSEGGSVIVYAAENGEYRELLNFYIGMQNVFTLARYDGHIFLVVAYPNLLRVDIEPNPDAKYVTGYGIIRFNRAWTPECLMVDYGEASVPDLSSENFWGVEMGAVITGKDSESTLSDEQTVLNYIGNEVDVKEVHKENGYKFGGIEYAEYYVRFRGHSPEATQDADGIYTICRVSNAAPWTVIDIMHVSQYKHGDYPAFITTAKEAVLAYCSDNSLTCEPIFDQSLYDGHIDPQKVRGVVFAFRISSSDLSSEAPRIIVLTKPQGGDWDVITVELPLQFQTETLYYKELPVIDKTQVSQTLKNKTIDGMTYTVYRKPGDDLQFYSYLTINGVDYDLGYMGYGSIGDSMLENWGLNKTPISESSPIYMMVRLHGADYVSSAFFAIKGGTPYLLYEFDGWGIQYDIDGDGAVETTANAGGSISQDYIIYEWALSKKNIRYVRLKEVLKSDIVRYDDGKNLFYAESRDNLGKWSQSAYEYKNEYLYPTDG